MQPVVIAPRATFSMGFIWIPSACWHCPGGTGYPPLSFCSVASPSAGVRVSDPPVEPHPNLARHVPHLPHRPQHPNIDSASQSGHLGPKDALFRCLAAQSTVTLGADASAVVTSGPNTPGNCVRRYKRVGVIVCTSVDALHLSVPDNLYILR